MTRKTITLTVVNEFDEPTTYYLPLLEQVSEEGKERLIPMRLGTGRNAVVLLAWTKSNQKAAQFLALKFLKDDENEEYAQMVKERFLIELIETKRASFDTDFFVGFKGHGILGNFDLDDEKNAKWRSLFSKWKKGKNSANLHTDVQNYFDLQGPFYILELCQGSLHDLLERGEPWLLASKSYQQVDRYKKAFEIQYENIREKVQQFQAKYIEEIEHSEDQSGYSILNTFKHDNEANKVRYYAVLQLFLEVAITIRNLHNLGLVHRDLKLGNLFLRHAANPMGFNRIHFKLADLGYAGSIIPLQKGTWTLEVDNWRTPGALVPGSQYFRAPEQARLPIEVRVDINKDDPKKVIIKSSKVTEIEKGDQLVVGDYFGESGRGTRNENNQRIINVIREGNVYFLDLDNPIDLPSKEDLQAHIIKSTGYHTDGFSLGAILYDLASGGKNPEDFYTYNLARFHKTSQDSSYSVRDIVDTFSRTERLEEQLGDLREELQGQIRNLDKEWVKQFETLKTQYRKQVEDLSQQYKEHYHEQATHLKEHYQKQVEDLNQQYREHYHEQATHLKEHYDKQYQKKLKNLKDKVGESTTIRVARLGGIDITEILDELARGETLQFEDPLAAITVPDSVKLNEKFDDIDFAKTQVNEEDLAQIVSDGESLEDQLVDHTETENPLTDQAMKANKLENTLVQDVRGVPIPEEILEIVVKCMVRDIHGAYYHSSPVEGYFTNKNQDAVSELVKDVWKILNEFERGTDIPFELKDNLLIKLRMFWKSPDAPIRPIVLEADTEGEVDLISSEGNPKQREDSLDAETNLQIFWEFDEQEEE